MAFNLTVIKYFFAQKDTSKVKQARIVNKLTKLNLLPVQLQIN